MQQAMVEEKQEAEQGALWRSREAEQGERSQRLKLAREAAQQ